MKKLIAIGVVFVLVAGAAFAAVEVGVDVKAMIVVVESTSAKLNDGVDPVSGAARYKDDTLRTGGQAHTAQISASASNESGTIGGKFIIKANGYTNSDGYNAGGAAPKMWGWAWWKPVDVIRLQFGTNAGDGEFEPINDGAWGFYRGDDFQISAANAWGGGYTGGDGVGLVFRDAYYGGYNGGGAVLTIGPFNGLSINAGIPFWSGSNTNVGGTASGIPPSGGKTLETTLKNIHAQIRYDIPNIGLVALTIRADNTAKNAVADEPKLFLGFSLTAIPNLGLTFAVGYQLPDVNVVDSTGLVTTSLYNPLFLGMTATVNADKLGLKFRMVMSLGGSVKTETTNTVEDPMPFKMLLDIMPTYQLSDSATVKVSFGIGLKGEDLNGAGAVTSDMYFAWHVNPYVVLSGAGGGAFYLGFRLEGRDQWKDARGDKYILWSLPIGIAYSF